MFKLKYLKYKEKYLQLKKQLGGENPLPTFCKEDKLMESINETSCVNASFVTGSCGDPAFYSSKGTADITLELKDQYIKIFNLIKEKKNIKYLDIILGALTNEKSSFNNLDESLQLCITPIDRFDSYEDLMRKLNENIEKKYTFNSIFPLNFHQTPNALEVLDLLIKINTEGIKVRITNRMCGTCHRSLYYLVKNKIDYQVDPEQGLGPLDTDEIQQCFKDFSYVKAGAKFFLVNGNNSKQVWPVV